MEMIHRIVKNTNAEYHTPSEYKGSTSLKYYEKSPAHYKYCTENPEPPTEAMKFGSAYHAFILEPEIFWNEVFVFDESKKPQGDKDYRTKENREWRDGLLTSNKGKICIASDDYKRMEEMKVVLKAHKEAWTLLTDGVKELSYYTEIDGVKVKCRPDNYKKFKFVADLKTCQSASKDDFTRHSANMQYEVSAALYTDIIQIAESEEKGESMPALPFFIVAQETKAPYAVQIFLGNETFCEVGRHKYLHYLAQHKRCLETGIYKGYEVYSDLSNNVTTLSIPPYKIKELPLVK